MQRFDDANQANYFPIKNSKPKDADEDIWSRFDSASKSKGNYNYSNNVLSLSNDNLKKDSKINWGKIRQNEMKVFTHHIPNYVKSSS